MLPSPGVVDHPGLEPGGDFAPPPFTVVIHLTGVIPHPGSVFPDCHEERGWSNAPSRGVVVGGGLEPPSPDLRARSCGFSRSSDTAQERKAESSRLPVVFSCVLTPSHRLAFPLVGRCQPSMG